MRIHEFSTLQDDFIRQRPAKYIKTSKENYASEKGRGFFNTHHVIITRSGDATHALHFVTYSPASVTFREILQYFFIPVFFLFLVTFFSRL